MRKTLLIAAVLAALLTPASIAVAHTVPACENSNGAAPDTNKHCQTDHGTATANANRESDGDEGDGDGVDNVDSDGPSGSDKPDNCPDDYNPNQIDSDEDGFGDVCDHARDGDDEDGKCSVPDGTPEELEAEYCGDESDIERDEDDDHPPYAEDTDGDGTSDYDEDNPEPSELEQALAGD